MKKNIIIAAIAAISAILLCASCQKQELVEQNNGIDASSKTFTATIEQSLTKTTITSEYKVNWVEGDQIDINGSIFSATPDASDATKASLTKVSGSDPAPDYTAVYPASIMVSTQPTLPATQTYAEGRFNAPMCAMSSTETLEFKNFCGVLCFALKGTDKVKSIAVTANEQLCGPFEFADATSISFTGENEGYTVTLDCGEGVQISSTDSTNFYVYLPPKDSYTAGMKIVVTSTEGKTFEKTTTTAVKIERNNLYTFDWTASFSSDLTGQRGNLNGHEYVIIKCGDKYLKWATMNIGATTVTGETSYGDYFMWGAVVKAYTSLSGTTFTFGSKPSSYTNSSWDASKGFAWENCNFTDGKYTASGQNVFTKYTADIVKYAKSGTADGKTDLEAVDDAAAQIWGSTWRIPTGGSTGEFQALYDATKWTWDATDKGYYVTKKDETLSADKSNALLFFPAAGYGKDTTLYYAGDYGFYWSSSIYSNTPSNGHYLKISSDSAKPAANLLRFYGSSVRPVSD